MHDKLPPGIKLIKADDFETWLMDIQVIDSNPLYEGETYRLKFNFSQGYPIEVRSTGSYPYTSPFIIERCPPCKVADKVYEFRPQK